MTRSLADRALDVVTGRRSKVAVLVAFVLVAGGLASQSGKLSQVTRSDLASTLPEGAESLRVLRATDRIGARVTPAVVVYRRDGGLTDADRRRVRTDRAALQEKRPPLASRWARPSSGATRPC